MVISSMRDFVKLYRFSDLESVPSQNPNYRFWVIERILKNSTPSANGCIEYGSTDLKHKYGLVSITFNNRRFSVPAHRAMWMAKNDKFDLPRSVYVRHTCDNPRCINDEHLIPGTAKDNSDDCTSRNRRAKNNKLHTRQRRLADEQIRQIRAATGKATIIAHNYGTTPSYVSKIRNMKAKTLV